MSENPNLDKLATQFLERQNNPGAQNIPAPDPNATAHVAPEGADLSQFKQNDSMPAQQMMPGTEAAPAVEYTPVQRPMTDEEFAAYMAKQAATGPAPIPQEGSPAVMPDQTVQVNMAPPQQMAWPKFKEDAKGELHQTQAPGATVPYTGPAPQQPAPQPAPQPPTRVSDPMDDLGGESIITGSGNAQASAPVDEFSEETIVLGEEALKALDGVEKSARERFIGAAVPEIQNYQKELVTKYGYTPDEAMQAARSRATKMALEELKKYQEEHPNGAIITIDKAAADKVEFTEEEKAKMQHAKALKLVVVESKELETLKIVPMDKRVEMSQIRSICGALAQYSVPMLSLGDYMTFRGAQSGFLASCCVSQDDTMLDAIEKKASILYSCFDGGVLTSKWKKDAPNEQISYDDFCNVFHYEDLDMGIYAVVTASAMENTESTYRCPNERCGHLYPIHYNQKALLDLSEIPDVCKQRIRDIDENRANLEGMRRIHEDAIMCTRLRSPVTNNVYEIGPVTIAGARALIGPNQRLIDVSTSVDLVLLLYITQTWIYDSSQGAYLPPIVTLDDPSYAFNTICTIHQADVELLAKFIHDTRYTPKFRIKTKCPRCGREAIDDLDVDDMVFLHARGTLTEIHQ